MTDTTTVENIRMALFNSLWFIPFAPSSFHAEILFPFFTASCDTLPSVGQHHAAVEEKVASYEIFCVPRKAEDEEIGHLHRRHHFFHPGFPHHDVRHNGLRGNA